MTTIPAERLARVFVEIADTLVDEFDLIDFMHMLAERTADLVGAPAVGLLLADQHGRLEFLAASDENTKLLELFQVQYHEGPCLDAFRTATPVVNADLADAAARWPRFAPRAAAAGFRSVHAFPLRLRSEVIGALNVFGDQPGSTLDDADVPIVQSLADVAAIGGWSSGGQPTAFAVPHRFRHTLTCAGGRGAEREQDVLGVDQVAGGGG